MRKVLSLSIAFLLLLLSVPAVSAEEVDVSAQAYVLFCADNGEALLSGNADARLPMASTTKIMTSLLALEEAAVENRIVTFTEEMIAEGSSMYLKVGEQVTLYDLAVGMMMQSGNDAANAAAIALDGSPEAFAQRMNEKAKAIGMTHTHFVTPSGLDDDDHYSTARDMALLMAYALKNPDFAQITAQTAMTVDFTEPADKSVTYPNHNRLLKLYDSCIGGKTGYTERSGRCLVTAARRDDMTLICVTLNDRDDWDDHIALYDYGFGHFAAVAPRDAACTLNVVGGTEDTVAVKAEREASFIIPIENKDQIETRLFLPSFVYAPIERGDRVGEVRYYLDGRLLSAVPVTAEAAVPYNENKRDFITYIKDLLHWHS